MDLQAPRASPSLRIALVTDDFLPATTGVGVHVQKLAQHLAARGHDVLVLTSRRRGQPARETWNGAAVHRLFSIPMFGFYQALPTQRSLRKLFLGHSVDVIHFHYLSTLLLQVLSVAKSMGVATVYTSHMSVDLLSQPAPMRLWRRRLRDKYVRLCAQFDHILCPSVEGARRIQTFNFSAHVHALGNPVDFSGGESDRRPPEDRFVVLFVGRLAEEKNLPLLLNALALVRRGHPRAELWIAGDGPARPGLEKEAGRLGLSAAVRFLGGVPHDRLPDLYAQCHVFALPSVKEVQPLVVLEAMRFSKPVVVTDRIFSARELVSEGVNGHIVDAEDPAALAGVLNRLAEDPAARQAMGAAGFAKSAAATWPKAVERLESIYLSAVPGPRPSFAETLLALDRRTVCVLCQRGSFDGQKEHLPVPSMARSFQEEYFTVWRCPTCRSIHSLPKVPMEDYRRKSPHRARRLNRWNARAFQRLLDALTARGLAAEDPVLFVGPMAALGEAHFRGRGFSRTQGTEDIFGPAAEATFGGVVVLDYLEQVEDPRGALARLNVLTRPGGICLVQTPDAERIRLDDPDDEAFQQPYRLHVLSQPVLEGLAEVNGFEILSLRRRYYLDTFTPFVNYRALHALAGFSDGTMEAGFVFRASQALRKFWRIPVLLFWGLAGRFFPARGYLLAVLRKRSAVSGQGRRPPR